MEKRMVHWQRYNHDEEGFNYLEIHEDGTLFDRRFEKSAGDPHIYDETERKEWRPAASIIIERLDFPVPGKHKEEDVAAHTEKVKAFPVEEWQTARREADRHQDGSEDDMRVDFHSLLVIEKADLPPHLQEVLKRTMYPIVKFRIEKEEGVVLRKKDPERLAVRFVPELNEHLYFYLHAKEKHLATTGDRLFALHTQQCEEGFCETDFEGYVESMVQAISADPERYHDLMVRQRNRRAMIDTDETGDLYPR